MDRLRVRASSVATVATLAFASVLPAAAATVANASTATASFWYAGTRLTFEHPQLRSGALAVGSDDVGLGRFLMKLGATLDYQPGQNSVVITAGDRKIVSLTIGDLRYTADGVTQTAPFAPYVSGGIVFLPFVEVARALHVDPIDDGSTTILQPQLAGLDVRTENRVTVLTFHGASPLHFKRLSDASDRNVSLAFTGVGSTLERDRTIAGAGLRGLSVVTSGVAKNPTTVVTFDAVAGSAHVLVPTDSPNTLTIAFAPAGTTLAGTQIPLEGTPATATQPLVVRDRPGAAATAPGGPSTIGAPAQAQGASAPAQITEFATDDTGDGLRVHLKIAGDVSYEWHRLPDNRWYVDFKPAALAVASQETPLQNAAVLSLRMKSFVGPSDRLATVRLAFTLATPRSVSLVPEPGGLTVAIDALDDSSGQRVGFGQIANGRVIAGIAAAPVPDPVDPTGATWKFSPAPAATGNNKLIVIDPGHGGSDAGAIQNGLTEKELNLDLSKRLRAMLVARGWQVKLTRDSDVDVFAPNDSAHDELQARDDVANTAGARIFISMHTNSYTSSSLNGTTTYYFTPSSYALAQAVHARFAATLPTKDDGIRKENFYVIHHAAMPSILIETAFMSNPGDAQYLRSPAFMQKLATAIADGVGDFATSPASAVSSATAADDR